MGTRLYYLECDKSLACCISPAERLDVLDWSHDGCGQFLVPITLRELRGKYYWPTRETDVEAYCKACVVCHQAAPVGFQASLRKNGSGTYVGGSLTNNRPFLRMSVHAHIFEGASTNSVRYGAGTVIVTCTVLYASLPDPTCFEQATSPREDTLTNPKDNQHGLAGEVTPQTFKDVSHLVLRGYNADTNQLD
ncbi:MAG: Integrase zinc binding domain [Subtercola sp.]|nr:Integrase zinc binding domain [Subtercola sp.]